MLDCLKSLALRSFVLASLHMKIVVSCILSCALFSAYAQKDSTEVIDGWSFGGVPVIAFNEDFGLQYGVIGNLFYYGDGGERYPYYDHSIYGEVTTTTRNDRRLVLSYDARELVDEGRFRAEVFQRLTHFRPFYGFNGYESLYNPDFADPSSSAYLSQLYYTYEQNVINASANLEKNVWGRGKTYRWQVMAQFTHMRIASPDRTLFNRGKGKADQVDDTPSLYDRYVEQSIISADEAAGGTYAQLAVGGVIDTRDIEPFPSSGVFEEVMLNYGAPIATDAPHLLALNVTHRHYLSLLSDRLVLAHRLQYQSYFNDQVPFYLLQVMGGSDTQRGIRFARMAGLGTLSANVELRAKVFRFNLFGQHFYGGVNLFFDTGRITKSVPWDRDSLLTTAPLLVTDQEDGWHHASGFGIKGAMNENFIVAIDYGKAFDARDGDTALYISLGWLF